MSAVLDADALGRAVRRIAHELIESGVDPDAAVLLGIPTRGTPLAHRVGSAIEGIAGLVVPVGTLDVTLFRDDLRQRAPMSVGATDVPVSVDGRTVVLVDDVLYTGRTIRAALDAVAELGRPSRIRLAVLVDRGHRELPIRADHVGKNLPTSYTDRVRVLLEEIDGRDAVVLEEVAS